MNYQIIDFENWKRKEHFLHFTKDFNCTSCLTSEIDITSLRHAAKAAGKSIYACLLYAVAKVVNAHEEFRMFYDWEKDRILLWDEVDISHIVFHEDSETVTRVWTSWQPDFEKFYAACQKDIENGKKHFGFSVPDVPKNIFDVSCLPWLKFSAVEIQVRDNYVYLAPIITWGKFFEECSITPPVEADLHPQNKKSLGENLTASATNLACTMETETSSLKIETRTKLPIAMQIHHGVADGFHISRFFKEVEQAANDLAQNVHLFSSIKDAEH